MSRRAGRTGIALLSTLVILSGCARLFDGDHPIGEAHTAVTGVHAAVHGAGSVTVEFNVKLGAQYSRSGAHWAGTSWHRYGDEPASETEYRSFSFRDAGATTSRVIDLHEITEGTLRQASVRYHRSEGFEAPADRPWVRLEPGEGIHYGPDIANPDLGVVDPEWYLELLASLAPGTVYPAVADEHAAVADVTTDVYRFACRLAQPECPYPGDDDPILRLFPGDNWLNLSLWLDGDGRPRRLEADFTFQFETPGSVLGGSTAVYSATATMTFSGYGAPVRIAPAPEADQISQWPPAA